MAMLEWEIDVLEKDAALHQARLRFDGSAEKVDKLLTDSLAVKILAMTIGRELTVQEIKDNLDVSIVTCYTAVKQLREVGLLVEVGKSRTSTHGLSTLYTSTIKASLIRLTSGHVEVLYLFRDGSVRTRTEQVFDEERLEASRRKRPVRGRR